MKIVYLTSGLTGSGRIVQGISIGNAIKRANLDCDYTIISSSDFAHLADKFDIRHKEIPVEEENELSPVKYKTSTLYGTLIELNPHVLLVDLQWFSIHSFISELTCKKIFLCRQIIERFFTFYLNETKINFNPGDYDLILKTEPFKSVIPMQEINPIIIRNRDEILSRDEAINKLGITDSEKNCLFAYNGKPGEFESIKDKYSHIEDLGYRIIYTTNYQGGLFPAVDYFNAFDYIISGAGYNAFWEVIYFKKEALFVPVSRIFENQGRRIQECHNHAFEENGADQLVEIIFNL